MPKRTAQRRQGELKRESESRSVVSDSLQPHVRGILQARILEWVVLCPVSESPKLREEDIHSNAKA